MKALAVIIALSASSATAQACGPRDEVFNFLKGKHGETVQATMLNQGGVVELHANRTTGSWTVTATSKNGTTCIIGDGSKYTYIGKPAGKPL